MISSIDIRGGTIGAVEIKKDYLDQGNLHTSQEWISFCESARAHPDPWQVPDMEILYAILTRLHMLDIHPSGAKAPYLQTVYQCRRWFQTLFRRGPVMTSTSLDYTSSGVSVTHQFARYAKTRLGFIPRPGRISSATYGYCLASRGAKGGYPGLTITPDTDLASTLEAMLGQEYATAGRFLQPVAPIVGGRRPEVYLVLHPQAAIIGEYPVVIGRDRGIFGIFADGLKTNTYPAIGVRFVGKNQPGAQP